MSIVDVLLAAGIIQGVFLAFFLYAKNNHISNRILSLIILLLTFDVFDDFLMSTELILEIPKLYNFSGMVLSWTIGPLLLLFVESKLTQQFKIKRYHLFHFLPAIISLFYFLFIISNLNELELINSIRQHLNSHHYDGPTIEHYSFNGLTRLFVYLIFTSAYLLMALAKVIVVNWRSGSLKLRKQLRYMINIVASINLVWFTIVLILLYSLFYTALNVNIAVLMTALFYVLAYLELIRKSGNEGVIRTELTGREAVQPIISKLEKAMSSERLFTSPDLTLSLLADKIGTTPHLLSELLNNQLQLSFNNYINKFRVDDFVQRLNKADLNTYTLASLAFESGFKTKSTFNTAFKKQMGVTPSEYLKKFV
ncbi:MAG: AraC family transcriptional regulator [Calditrichaeota bacterium]|nr:AraC family transcriptional regulator [Calditrichota bacterium]